MAWGCPSSQKAIRSLVPVLHPQHMLLLSEGTRELCCLLCSWLQKQLDSVETKPFKGVQVHEEIVLSALAKQLLPASGYGDSKASTNQHWLQLSISLQWQDCHSSGITAALWMLWGSPPAFLCQIFSHICFPWWSPDTLSPSFLWAWNFRGQFCYSTFSKSNCVPASGVLLSLALLNSEQTISIKNSTRHLMAKACGENVPWNST